jgi:hypothetical protein
LRRNCVQSSAGTNALQSLCGYFERTFPKYPKKYKIRQYIEISLEAQKRNSFNYLSKRSRELIRAFRAIQSVRTQNLALFTVSEDTARFMLEDSLKLFTTYFFLSSFPSFCSSTAQLGHIYIYIYIRANKNFSNKNSRQRSNSLTL